MDDQALRLHSTRETHIVATQRHTNTAREKCRVTSATPRSINRTSMIAYTPKAISLYDPSIDHDQPTRSRGAAA
jgi:hypothetical protein